MAGATAPATSVPVRVDDGFDAPRRKMSGEWRLVVVPPTVPADLITAALFRTRRRSPANGMLVHR